MNFRRVRGVQGCYMQFEKKNLWKMRKWIRKYVWVGGLQRDDRANS